MVNVLVIAVPAALGAILMVLGLVITVRALLFVQRAARTHGKVVGYDVRTERVGKTTGLVHYPKFEFEDDRGQKHCVTSTTWNSPPIYSEGDEVNVLYDANNPNDARLTEFRQMWALPVIMTVMGAWTALGFLAYGFWSGIF
jgi:hypothetical protein